MAKKTAGGRRAAGPAQPKPQVAAPTQVQAQIVIGEPGDIPNYYSNFIEVGHNQHEFVLNFVRTPTSLSPSKMQEIAQTGKIVVEPILQVTLPPTLIPGLLKALQLQKEKFNKAFGQITGDTAEPSTEQKAKTNGIHSKS